MLLSSLPPGSRCRGAAIALALALLAGMAGAAPQATLHAYADEGELQAALERWRSRAVALQPRRSAAGTTMELQSGNAAPAVAMAPAPAAPLAANPANATNVTNAAKAADASAAGATADGITNVQTAGVDEGGIVKRVGDHLLILRRGRLFTVRVGGDALAPVSVADAYAPGTDPQGAWYDELLVSGSTVVVVGYSYQRGGTEIGLFDLHPDGKLAYRATWHLRSFDYYSSRNYASRLVGSKLVFYTPQVLHPWQAANTGSMPGLRRWQGAGTPAAFQRILPATRVYRTDDEFDPAQPLALHTVTACELATRELQCESTAVLGPTGRVFYVSAGSVYVWTTSGPRRRGPWEAAVAPQPERSLSAVFRLPLDGTAPTALKAAGAPIDAMSFLEDDRGMLNVLLRDSGAGDGMWASERPRGGQLALLRVPLADFGDGRQAAGRRHYRALPAVPSGALQNRFVGDWLLWGATAAPDAFALRFAGDAGALQLAPGHAIERIEALGGHALLVGNRGADLHFSAVRLGTDDAVLAGRHVQAGARQGETRTHGFFYRATGRDEGLLGLPVLQPDGGVRRGTGQPARAGAASVAFVRQSDLAFTALGQLDARADRGADDACKASCVDWYGNARPIFIGERVFALMGYELVEGRLAGGLWRERLVERRRIDFAPPSWREGTRHWPFQ